MINSDPPKENRNTGIHQGRCRLEKDEGDVDVDDPVQSQMAQDRECSQIKITLKMPDPLCC